MVCSLGNPEKKQVDQIGQQNFGESSSANLGVPKSERRESREKLDTYRSFEVVELVVTTEIRRVASAWCCVANRNRW